MYFEILVPGFFVIALSFGDSKIRKLAAKCLKMMRKRISTGVSGYFADFFNNLHENITEIRSDPECMKKVIFKYVFMKT